MKKRSLYCTIADGEKITMQPVAGISRKRRKKVFAESCEVEYFVFTDVDHLAEEEDNPRIHRIFQEPMPWPYTTLLRFEIFLKAEEQLKAFDYIYFFNANCEFKQPITRNLLFAAPGEA